MADRQARVERKTKETQIDLTLRLDSADSPSVKTGLPFLDHMLEAFACHGRFGLEVKATGDIEVDPHHLMEDTGIVLAKMRKKLSVRKIQNLKCAGQQSRVPSHLVAL